MLNSALPRQRHRPNTWPEYQDPVSHTAQKKRKEGREGGRRKENKVIKIKNKKNYIKIKNDKKRKKEESNQTNKQIHQIGRASCRERV